MKIDAEIIELLMANQRITQKDLSEKMGVSTSAVSTMLKAINNGGNVLTVTAGKLAEAFEVDVEDIVEK